MNLFTVIMSLATCVSAVAAFLTLLYMAIIRRSDIKRKRQESTLEAYNRLQAEVLDNLNKYTVSQITEIASNNRSEEFKTISAYVARIEHFCTGISLGIYDEITVYELAHGYFDSDWFLEKLSPIIDKKNARSDEDYYNHTHEVTERLKRINR